MTFNWLRHRSPSADASAPGPGAGEQRRDSAEYQRAHREARQLVAAYLQDIGATLGAQEELASPSAVPSARIALARRSAA